MTNKREIAECKLQYLYQRLENLDTTLPSNTQAAFLLNEIDYYQTELLKLETAEYYQLIDDEDN